ncbi:MAG: redox-regulated ATPase YchF [Deltaproteobacteria bacterium]|nr:redox-regulated ATPase YchF [Deltaproteobacteria bacterium]
MRVGICGYPGSGKTTVFSALAPGARPDGKGVTYGNIKVPDDRVERLARIFSPKKKTLAEISFVDVGNSGAAGKGAFPPEVLQNMRNMDVLVHVVRVFDNPMLAERPDPERDVSLFSDEIVLLDHTILEKRAARWKKENRKGLDVDVNERCVACLEDGRPLRELELTADELATLTGIQLLSIRPLITLYNLSEDAWDDEEFAPLKEVVRGTNQVSLALSGSIEAEVAEMDEEEQVEFLQELGLGEPARNPFIREAYALLDLISFLTAGQDECRAWTVRRGSNARKAAGRIHSDIERGFIRAEVYRVDELEEAGTEAELKKVGKIRVEGKEYVAQDGDVMHFRFNV